MFGRRSIVMYLAIAVVVIAAAAFLIIRFGVGGTLSTSNDNQGLDIKISDKYLKELAGCKQLVLVTATDYFVSDTTVRTYERDGNTWKPVIPATPSCIGAAGFAESGKKKEGDSMSPTGAFTFGVCFGNKDNPGVKMEYRKTTENDFWVDDSKSKYYNTWQTGPADGRWTSAECLGLTGPVYDYAAVINYNTDKPKPGLGSAIFMHIWSAPGGITAGCTAMSEETLLQILKWFDPAKKPMILQGVEAELTGTKK